VAERIERIGQVLFRWRSFTPVPLLAVAVPRIWRSRGGGGTAWAVAGIGLCAAGQALRAWVLGQVPDGTSGQNERLIATELNTSGPYARTRNPLYLGRFLILTGLCVMCRLPYFINWVLLAIGYAVFFFYYMPRKERVEPARQLGGRPVLVATGRGAEYAAQARALGIPVVADLAAAAAQIVRGG